MSMFPTKVWEPTSITPEGKRLWCSRAVTREDTRRRTLMLTWLDPFVAKDERDAARDALHPW
jgi:hypothetical protein